MRTRLICIDDRWIGGEAAPKPLFAQRVTATKIHRAEDGQYYELSGYPGFIYETKGFARRHGPCEKKISQARKALQMTMDFVI